MVVDEAELLRQADDKHLQDRHCQTMTHRDGVWEGQLQSHEEDHHPAQVYC